MPAMRAISSGLPLGFLGQAAQHCRPHAHKSVRARRAPGFRLGGNVHHARAARGIEMREFFHFSSTRISSPPPFGAIRIGHQKGVGARQRGHVARAVPVHGRHFRAVGTEVRGQKARQPGAMAELARQPRKRHVQRDFLLPARAVPAPRARRFRKSPWWTTDSRAVRKRTCRAPGRTPAAVPAESGRGRSRIPRRARPAPAPPHRTCPRKRRRRAAADRTPRPRSISSRGVLHCVARHRQNRAACRRRGVTCAASEYALELRI